MPQLKCLLCVAEHKMHGQTIGADGAPPEMRDAVTVCQSPMGPVTPICYEHLEVARASSLLVPAGPLPVT
jgi:hypothetical protein